MTDDQWTALVKSSCDLYAKEQKRKAVLRKTLPGSNDIRKAANTIRDLKLNAAFQRKHILQTTRAEIRKILNQTRDLKRTRRQDAQKAYALDNELQEVMAERERVEAELATMREKMG